MQDPPEEIKRLVAAVLGPLAEEAKRLQDKSILLQGRDLLDFFFVCSKQLGTKAHELALESLEQQLRVVRLDARRFRSSLWRDFVERRAEEKELVTSNREIDNYILQLREDITCADD